MIQPSNFKKDFSFEQRVSESDRVLQKHPNKIPIICEKALGRADLPEIDKIKYLVPMEFTLGQFMYVVRQRIKLKSEEALFFIIGNSFFSSSTIIGHLYYLYKNKDGFLYIQYSKENTFG